MPMGSSIRWVIVAVLAGGLAASAFGRQEPAPQPPPATEPSAKPPAAEAPAKEVQPETPAPPTAPPATAAPQPGEESEVVVTLRDGQRYTGVLVSRDDTTVVIRIGAIETKLKTGLIDRVQVLPPVQERYRQLREVIDDNDVEGLLRLVQWLRSKSQWDDALAELGRVLAIQPDHPQALELRNMVESQRELARKAGLGKRPPPPKASPKAEKQADFPLLSDRDVNLMKVYEVDLTDPPRMVIDRDTIKALIEEHEGDPLMPTTPEGRDALYRTSPSRLLDLMFRIQARNLYEKVKVIDNPRSMKLFRDRVHRGWLINSCSTSRCHGGNEAGRLMLATDKPGSDTTLYTNFLILERYKTREGKSLINYEEPAKSVLLQMGLARDRSAAKHPEVPGMQGNSDLFKPVFKSEDDSRFQDAVSWIKAMYRPRPVYPVEYTPPGPEPIPPADPKAPPVKR